MKALISAAELRACNYLSYSYLERSCRCTVVEWWELGFDSRHEQDILLSIAFTPSLGPTQPPIQWAPEALSLRINRLGREADHSPLSSAEVNDAWDYTSTLPYVFMP
jgi:hypothetical protein